MSNKGKITVAVIGVVLSIALLVVSTILAEEALISPATATVLIIISVILVFIAIFFAATGDCTPVAIPEDVKLEAYDFIQLPHHGKPALADEIFERADDNIDITYVVSDNTGNSNGGSDDLNCVGHKIKNTKDGDILLTEESAKPSYSGRTLNV